VAEFTDNDESSEVELSLAMELSEFLGRDGK
jgi:hypothetical protein